MEQLVVTATWDGTTDANGMKMYFDGVLKYQDQATIAAIQSTATDITISDNSTYFYKGLMRGVTLYNRELTVAEILAVYNGTVTRTGLVGEWLLNEKTGTTAFDSAGTNNGTHVGGVSLVPTRTAASGRTAAGTRTNV